MIGCPSDTDRVLPQEWNTEFIKNHPRVLENPVELGTHNNFLLVLLPVEGEMSFSSSNNHIGLYEKRKLVDEIVFGSIPMKLTQWSSDPSR